MPPSSHNAARSTALDRGTIVGLDLVRFAAALFVVVFHYAFFSWHEPASDTGVRAAIGVPVSYPRLVFASWWGWVGVQIFFVISGLVICLSAERQSAMAFLRSRFLRLAPALWVFATLSLIVTLLYASSRTEEVLAMYARSLVLFPRGPWIDGVYWTLTIEAVFYAVTLLLIAAGWFIHLQGIAATVSLAIFGFYLLVLVARVWPETRLAEPMLAIHGAYISRVLLLTTGAYFLVGVSLYLLDRDGWSLTAATGFCTSLLSGSVGIWLSAEALEGATQHGRSPAIPVAIWLAAVGLLALSLRWHRRSGGAPRLRSFARSLGLATYPLYLVHNIAGAFAFGLLLKGGMGAGAALVTASLLCLLVSLGFARWLEPACRRALARLLHRLANLRGAVSLSDSKGRDRT